MYVCVYIYNTHVISYHVMLYYYVISSTIYIYIYVGLCICMYVCMYIYIYIHRERDTHTHIFSLTAFTKLLGVSIDCARVNVCVHGHVQYEYNSTTMGVRL